MGPEELDCWKSERLRSAPSLALLAFAIASAFDRASVIA